MRILSKVNAKTTSPRVDRVLWLLEALIKAERLRLQLYEATYIGTGNSISVTSRYDAIRDSFADPQLQALNLEFQETLKQIEQSLKRYRWTPTIRSGDFYGLTERHIWPKKSAEDNWENWAVFWLINHAAEGSSGRSQSLILRFRRCRQCQTWLYARTKHQEHCSARCRKKLHSESPEFKGKRAKYMRETYRPQQRRRGELEGRRR